MPSLLAKRAAVSGPLLWGQRQMAWASYEPTTRPWCARCRPATAPRAMATAARPPHRRRLPRRLPRAPPRRCPPRPRRPPPPRPPPCPSRPPPHSSPAATLETIDTSTTCSAWGGLTQVRRQGLGPDQAGIRAAWAIPASKGGRGCEACWGARCLGAVRRVREGDSWARLRPCRANQACVCVCAARPTTFQPVSTAPAAASPHSPKSCWPPGPCPAETPPACLPAPCLALQTSTAPV